MRRFTTLAGWVTLLAALGAGAAFAKASPRVAKAQVVLAADAAVGAQGKIEVQRRRATRRAPETEAMTLRLRRLDPGETYTVWCLDPLSSSSAFERIAPWDAVVPSKKRTALVRFDTKSGGSLPFGATLDQLAGCRVQIRDSAGLAVLVGSIPAVATR